MMQKLAADNTAKSLGMDALSLKATESALHVQSLNVTASRCALSVLDATFKPATNRSWVCNGPLSTFAMWGESTKHVH